tara:strand:+ start:486 stop:1109 length:624 start_codon:yes stop_codon:yes gene_type:complete
MEGGQSYGRVQEPPQKKVKGGAGLKRCIVSNIAFPKDKMIRFVVSPDGEIIADIEARLPGRGYWLRAHRDVINVACTKSCFVRAARMKVRVSVDLADRVERSLVRKCQELIGLARRAGQVISGFTKVEAWLRSGKPVGALLAAVDAAEYGGKKIWTWADGAPVIAALHADEIGLAFSREYVVHVIISPGRLAKNLQATAWRLEGLRC